MEEKRSLTPAQIQYLRIGPKVCTSTLATKKLQDTLDQQILHYRRQHLDGAEPSASISNISKFTYGNFEQTVNNFGVLLHRNFVGASTLLQAQKFGNIASKIDKYMQQQKDKPAENRRTNQRKSVSDSRTSIKGIYDYKGFKLLLTLKSFAIESLQSNRVLETLQIPFLRLLVTNAPSSKLIKYIENAMRQEGATITIDYEKMQAKIGHSSNNEARYQQGPYTFERSGQQLAINLPHLQLLHSQSEYKQNVYLQNKDILDILDSDFDNVEDIVHKYFDLNQLESKLGKTGIDRHSFPEDD